MGKRNKLRQARRQRAEQDVCAVLEAHSRRDSGPTVAVSYGDFAPEYRDKIETYRAFALRPPEAWRCRIKSRSQDRRFVDLVRFAFARYPAPAHLEEIWIRDGEPCFADDLRTRDERSAERRPAAAERPQLPRWYIIATQGGSLHKQAAHPYLSRQETHHFLAPPAGLTTDRVFWYAIARAHDADVSTALRVAQTKLSEHSVGAPFWRDVARFFVRQPTTLAEMNDLIDFIRVAKADDDDFTLKGRTLAALCRRMHEWHHALQKEQAICGGSWTGSPLPDIEYRAGRDDKAAVWRFRQIKTGNDLFHEGQRMRHCVASYKERCIKGEVSIWSLDCEYPPGHFNKGVTIELRKSGMIVQCRGVANRLPYANEAAMVQRWAHEHGLGAPCLT